MRKLKIPESKYTSSEQQGEPGHCFASQVFDDNKGWLSTKMNRKLIKSWIKYTLLQWAAYFFIWIAVCFVQFKLHHPFKWLIEIETIGIDGRIAVLMVFIINIGFKWFFLKINKD